MKSPRSFLLIVMAFAFQSGTAQVKISPLQAGDYVGQIVSVCGIVSGTKYLSNVPKKLTFLNMGGQYPNNAFTIVISEDARKNFVVKPEEYYQNKELCVTGKIEMYRGTPQINVLSQLDLPIKNNGTGLQDNLVNMKKKVQPVPASSPPVAASNTLQVVVLKKSASLRSGPGDSFDVIKTLKAGHPVIVKSSKKGWTYVHLQTEGTRTAQPVKGFVRAELVQ